jgi:hypothetical protein
MLACNGLNDMVSSVVRVANKMARVFQLLLVAGGSH